MRNSRGFNIWRFEIMGGARLVGFEGEEEEKWKKGRGKCGKYGKCERRNCIGKTLVARSR